MQYRKQGIIKYSKIMIISLPNQNLTVHVFMVLHVFVRLCNGWSLFIKFWSPWGQGLCLVLVINLSQAQKTTTASFNKMLEREGDDRKRDRD